MEPERFDRLVTVVGHARSRRGVLRGLFGSPVDFCPIRERVGTGARGR
jgi:GTPase